MAKAVGLIKNGVQGLGAPVSDLCLAMSDLCLAIGPMATEVLSGDIDSLFGARPETGCRIPPETGPSWPLPGRLVADLVFGQCHDSHRARPGSWLMKLVFHSRPLFAWKGQLPG